MTVQKIQLTEFNTVSGKRSVYDKVTGRKLEMFPVDAKEAIASGRYAAAPPGATPEPAPPEPMPVVESAPEAVEPVSVDVDESPPVEEITEKPKKKTTRRKLVSKKK